MAKIRELTRRREGEALFQVLLPAGRRRPTPVHAGAGPARQRRWTRPKPCTPERHQPVCSIPATMEVETGWCDHAQREPATSAVQQSRCRGVTVEMLDWWFCLALAGRHALRHLVSAGPFRHLHQQERPRARLLGSGRVPIKEKIYGRTDHVVEDVGHGRGRHLHLLLRTRRRWASTWTASMPPNVAAVYGGYGLDHAARTPSRGPSGRPPSCATSSARYRGGDRVPDSRFWMGYTLIDGQAGLHAAATGSRCRSRPYRVWRSTM